DSSSKDSVGGWRAWDDMLQLGKQPGKLETVSVRYERRVTGCLQNSRDVVHLAPFGGIKEWSSAVDPRHCSPFRNRVVSSCEASIAKTQPGRWNGSPTIVGCYRA